MLLRAIAASTGDPGRWTTPSVARVRVNRMSERKGGDRADEDPTIVNDQDQRENEEQMVESSPNMLDAHGQIEVIATQAINRFALPSR